VTVDAESRLSERLDDGRSEPQPERARRILQAGVLAFRWTAFIWMVVANVLDPHPLRRPGIAWAALTLTGLWVVFLTLRPWARPAAVLGADLFITGGLVVLSGFVMAPHTVAGGRLFFATTYPASTALAWGASRGSRAGVLSGLGLGLALALSRQANGIPLSSVSRSDVESLMNGVVYFVLAGLVAGLIADTLDRSAEQMRVLIHEALLARDRAARLAERESLARRLHDSVLQALALVHKKGRELGRHETVPGADVLALAEMAGEQEGALRSLILRSPDENGPAGAESLRDTLEATARRVPGIPVTVSSAGGSIWLPGPTVSEIDAAVGQALENVVRHAGATRASVFADEGGGWVVVSVRDDGAGFAFDEHRLRENGRAGLLKSVIGRIEDLGGRVRIESAPGAGTEIEMQVPIQPAAEGARDA
jgi:signal transduction histidine kinase